MAKKPEHLIEYARKMRKSLTPAEKILWKYLRSKRFCKLKFRCQQPINPYIVDFFCSRVKLVIELDGESHLGKERYDAQRQTFLEAQGLTIIRFWDSEIYNNINLVLDVIENCCQRIISPPPNPLPQGEGE